MMMLIVIGSVVMLLNLGLELVAVGATLDYLVSRIKAKKLGRSQLRDSWHMGVVLLILLFSHLLQIGLWAGAFMWCGEFETFNAAYYHSAVNFAALGYGDIVMSEEWRLLGGLEAAVGVMMFGVSSALLFAVMSKVIKLRLANSGGGSSARGE